MKRLSGIMTGLLRFNRVNKEDMPKIAYMLSQFIKSELASDSITVKQRTEYREMLEYYNEYNDVN